MQLARNSAFSVIQVLVSTTVLLLAYRQISTRLGLVELGIWSVVSAVAAVGRIADLGAGTAMVRLLPPILGKGDFATAGRLVVTAFSLVAITLLVVLPVAFPLLIKLTGVVVADVHADLIRQLLALSLLSLMCNASGSCLLGTLEAMQRYDQRFVTVLIGNLVFLAMVLILAPTLGLVGLAVGVVAQAAISLIVGWWYVRAGLRLGKWLPLGFHRQCARRVFATGGPLQGITLANLAFEPTTRLLLAKFAGIEWAAIFDVAERIVNQARSLLMAALQVSAPRFATIAADARQEREGMYRLVYGLTWCLSVVGFGIVYAALPALGTVALGTQRPELLLLGAALTIAWHLNTMSGPAYFSILGGGRLAWIVLAHVVLAMANIVLGLWWGAMFGAPGVIGAFVVALVIGSALNLIGHHKDFGYSVLPVSARDAMLAGGVAAVVAMATFAQMQSDSVMETYFYSAMFAIVLLAFGAWTMRPMLTVLWRDRMRHGE